MIPKSISKTSLREIADPSETHIVRVILHDVSNESRYVLRCRSRQYVFERHHTVGRHVLDVPLSLWMEGVNTGTKWKDNTSIPEDIRNSPRSVSIHILPLSAQESTESGTGEVASDIESPFPQLKRLLAEFRAPDPVRECVQMVEDGAPIEDVRTFVDRAVADLENEESAEPESQEAKPKPAPVDNLAKARAAKKQKAEAEKAAAEKPPTAPDVL